jgi:hypothetical protein
MATVTLSVPDKLLRRAMSKLNCKDEADLQELFIQLLVARAMDGMPIDKLTEAKLLEGLDSPLVEMNEASWKAKLQRYATRHRKRKRA